MARLRCLRVVVVELLRVAALAGLAVGVALVVDRGAVGLGVEELVAARGLRSLPPPLAGARRARVPTLLGCVALVEFNSAPLGVAEVGLLGEVLGQVGPPVVPVVAHGHVRAEVADHRVQRS